MSLLGKLSSSSSSTSLSTREVIDVLKQIEALDDGNTYRVEETVNLFRETTSPLRSLITSSAFTSDDDLIAAVGNFFLWFLPQPEKEPVKFKTGQDICISDSRLTDFFIDTLLPNARVPASIYSVCRTVCRIIYKSEKSQTYIIQNHRSAGEFINTVRRSGDDDTSLHWSVTMFGNMCGTGPEPRLALAQPEVVETILSVFTHDTITPLTAQWAAAAIFNLQYECEQALELLRSDSSYVVRLVENGLPKISTSDGFQWILTTIGNIVKLHVALFPMRTRTTVDALRKTLYSSEKTATIFMEAKKRCVEAGLRNEILWSTTVSSLLGGSPNEGDPAPMEYLKMFAKVEEEMISGLSADEQEQHVPERIRLRRCKNRREFINLISDSTQMFRNNLRGKDPVRTFNNMKMLLEKIDDLLQQPQQNGGDDDDDDDGEEKQHFIVSVVEWFKIFFNSGLWTRLAVDGEQMMDLFFLSLLSHSTWRKCVDRPGPFSSSSSSSTSERILDLLVRYFPQRFCEFTKDGRTSTTTTVPNGRSKVAFLDQVICSFEKLLRFLDQPDEECTSHDAAIINSIDIINNFQLLCGLLQSISKQDGNRMFLAVVKFFVTSSRVIDVLRRLKKLSKDSLMTIEDPEFQQFVQEITDSSMCSAERRREYAELFRKS